jgi:hypothetical protein
VPITAPWYGGVYTVCTIATVAGIDVLIITFLSRVNHAISAAGRLVVARSATTISSNLIAVVALFHATLMTVTAPSDGDWLADKAVAAIAWIAVSAVVARFSAFD